MDLKQIHELIKIVNKSNIGEISIEDKDGKVTIKQILHLRLLRLLQSLVLHLQLLWQHLPKRIIISLSKVL
jgi:hypothetical protein